jgi:hypothetical protein
VRLPAYPPPMHAGCARSRLANQFGGLMTTPRATHTYTSGGLPDVLEFLKRTRCELRTLRFVRVWKDRMQVIDVNQDYFEVTGLGYRDADIVPLLHNLNTAFNPETIHNDIEAEYKEFGAGKCHPWAYDRVM